MHAHLHLQQHYRMWRNLIQPQQICRSSEYCSGTFKE
jgi:hypothetical protein